MAVETLTFNAVRETLTINGQSFTFNCAGTSGGSTTETDPVVRAIVGIVKSDGTTISAAAADTDYQSVPAEGAFADGDKSKLNGIEAGAQVNDAESDPIASAALSTHIGTHPAPTTRDARNEAAGVAASTMTAHTDNHPAPTTRDVRNEAADAAIQTHITGTGSPHTAAGVGAESAGAVATHNLLGTSAHGGIVASDDARLTDARTPTTHGNDKHSSTFVDASGAVTAMGAKADANPLHHDRYAHPNHTGDVTSSGDGAQTIANNAVTLAKMADVDTARILGRTTAGTGDPEALTKAQAIALLQGTAIGDLVKLEDVGGSPGLPAVDGSQLTGIAGGGGGLVNTLAELTALAFEFPATGITTPFTNAAHAANVTLDVDNYADKAVLLSTSSNEPLQFPQRFKIPTGCTGVKFRFVYAPETGNTWGGETVVFKGENKEVTDNAAWGALNAFTIGTDTVPGSGSGVQIYEATIALATLGLAVGDVVQMVVFVDSTSTWASDVALFSATAEASDA